MIFQTNIVVLFLSLVFWGCSFGDIIDEVRSPNNKYQAIFFSDKNTQDKISFQILDTETADQIVFDPLFFESQLFETIESDYPNRVWLTNSVFAVGMFKARKQISQKLKISNDTNTDIESLRLSGFHNRIYILDVKKKDEVDVPFFTELDTHTQVARFWIEINFADNTKRKKQFCLSVTEEPRQFRLFVKSTKLDLLLQEPNSYHEEDCGKFE